jgi:hypothetical protein
MVGCAQEMPYSWIEMKAVIATITCPACGHTAREPIPTDRCLFFYECLGCHAMLKPKPGDCCVFCSYADVRCPSRQSENSK